MTVTNEKCHLNATCDGLALNYRAWPATPDDDTSEDLITLVDVDTSSGFTVVVIEPLSGLTFLALATGESHGHCDLPHVEGQWSACGCYRIYREAQLTRSKLTHTMSRVHSTRAMQPNRTMKVLGDAT